MTISSVNKDTTGLGVTDDDYDYTIGYLEEPEDEDAPKYTLTDNTMVVYGATLYQIKALKSFSDVKEGDLGGYIASEANLGQDGNAWVYPSGIAMDNASVFGDAKVYGIVLHNARVSQNAEIYGAIFGDARAYGKAQVRPDARVYGTARIRGTYIVANEESVFEGWYL